MIFIHYLLEIVKQILTVMIQIVILVLINLMETVQFANQGIIYYLDHVN